MFDDRLLWEVTYGHLETEVLHKQYRPRTVKSRISHLRACRKSGAFVSRRNHGRKVRRFW